MSIPNFFDAMKKIQSDLLEFIEDESNDISNFQNLIQDLQNQKCCDNKYELNIFLTLVLKISNNHKRFPNFFNKIDQILKNIKNEISKNFSNAELFHIFHSNKRILLFLIKENLLTVDRYFITKIFTEKFIEAKYPQYFSPEIRPFICEPWFPIKEGNDLMNEIKNEPDFFEQNRTIGENEEFICQLIRNDSIEEFVRYITKTNYNIRNQIYTSIYETNLFLIKKPSSLIEYAAYFGSIQIFQYLKFNNVNFTPSLWLYSMHSGNPEIIHALEENHVNFVNISYNQCLFEAIKCHSNDIANYIKNAYILINNENVRDIFINSLKYYNFDMVQNELINNSAFVYLCQYNYFYIVDILLKENGIDINQIAILKKNYLIQFYYFIFQI